MRRSALLEAIKAQKSCLCVGLDTDPTKIPSHLFEETDNALLAFNKAIIQATAPYSVAYKLNTAFYEALGVQGWQLMADTIQAIPADKMVIADAKRGDIGNTAAQYAKAFFEELNVDAVTLSPYMGRDTIAPFLAYPDKAVMVLGLTTNASAQDFQFLEADGKPLHRHVMNTISSSGPREAIMFVVGGTQVKALREIRKAFPHHVFLVPGVGAQSAGLREVLSYGLGADRALLVNVSRGIIYHDQSSAFTEGAAEAAASYQAVMQQFL